MTREQMIAHLVLHGWEPVARRGRFVSMLRGKAHVYVRYDAVLKEASVRHWVVLPGGILIGEWDDITFDILQLLYLKTFDL